MKNTQKLENIHRLEKLYKYLNYEINTSWFLPVAWLMYLMFGNNGVAIIGLILSVAAIVFSPFLIYVLRIEENVKERNGCRGSFARFVYESF